MEVRVYFPQANAHFIYCQNSRPLSVLLCLLALLFVVLVVWALSPQCQAELIGGCMTFQILSVHICLACLDSFFLD